MAKQKMTVSKTKLARALHSSISSQAKSMGVAAAFLLSASNVSALGLGALDVNSNLDQPLNGTIELRVADGDDLSTLTAVIASRETFESLGVDYPRYLQDFSLLLDTVDGERRLHVTSNEIVIKEPFIHFLVRVEWSGGSFLREYTALIDPPVYAAEAPTAISEPRQVGTDQRYEADLYAEGLTAVGIDNEDPLASVEPLIEDNLYSDDTVSVDQNADFQDSLDTDLTDARYGPVAAGESLSIIAQELQRQFPDLSIYQIMKVMFEENRSSFIGGNINGLIKGSILNIGDLEAIRAVNVTESRAFFSQQVADWNPELLRPRAGSSINVGQDNYNFQDDSSFASGSTAADDYALQDSFQVGASSESNDYLSSDQGDAGDGEVLALRREVTLLRSSLASSELEGQELNERIALLEVQLSDMNRLVELSIESADLANLEATLAEQNDFSEAVDNTSQGTNKTIDNLLDAQVSTEDSVLGGIKEDVDIDNAVAIATTQPLPTLNVVREQSFFDKIQASIFDGGGWNQILAGLGVLLAAGAAILFMRRRRVDEEFEISMLSIESNSHSIGHSGDSADTASMSASQTASMASAAMADKETSFLTVYSDSDAVVQADEVDPVAEADVYIAYGRDEQAEEVLLDGVTSHPDRVDIKQKLLSLYHKRQNTEGFERIAEELYSQRPALSGDVWQQVCEMGKEVAPSNPLFKLSGDDLNVLVEEESELLLEADSISEVPMDSSLSASDEQAVEGDDSKQVANLNESFSDRHSDLEEALTFETESATTVAPRSNDEASQLINLNDDLSAIGGSDELQIDPLEFVGDIIPEPLDLSTSLGDDIVDISVNNEDEKSLLGFDLEHSAGQVDEEKFDDIEAAFGKLQEVSDLEIDPDYDEARTQYELAKVFVDLGDEDGARKILTGLVENNNNSADVLSDAKALLESIDA